MRLFRTCDRLARRLLRELRFRRATRHAVEHPEHHSLGLRLYAVNFFAQN